MSASDPEAVFAAWAVRIERGEAADFETLVREHSEHADALRRLHRDWMLFAPLLSRVVPGLLAGGIPGSAVASDESGHDKRSDRAEEFVAELGLRIPLGSRYRFRAVVGRGGGGVVLKVWDAKLDRDLAMKVVLGHDAPHDAEDPRYDRRALSRFVSEARIAGRLDHPGIVPVHELGADEAGRGFFTMKLVQGRTLADILREAREGDGEWSDPRVVGLLLRVCDAMAYAHDRRVLHRDLKPSNVMVGSFGEVYVMDWGLARILGRPDTRDIRIRLERSTGTRESSVAPATRDDEDASESFVTMDGTILGTPAYMSPEQARGDIELLGPATDVYSVGGMLYELLAGHPPYMPPSESRVPHSVLARVVEGASDPLEVSTLREPTELRSICARAMARDPKDRYPSVQALGDDLRAYLEGRRVAAHPTHAWRTLWKWARRNRLLTALAVATVLIPLAMSFGWSYTLSLKNRELQSELDRSSELATLALSSAEIDTLAREASELWPPHPALLPRYEAWVVRARGLIEGRDSPAIAPRDRRRALNELQLLEEHLPKNSDSGSTYEQGRLLLVSALVAKLERFADSNSGLYSDGASSEAGWGMKKRLDFARTIGVRSIDGPDARTRWAQAISEIHASPRYGGLRLTPQMGLLPLGPDQRTGLWQFAHLQSGEPVELDPEGTPLPKDGSGMVMILIPSATFVMGGQAVDPKGVSYDEKVDPAESPPHKVTLDAFFVSKYEMTQGQWERATGSNPSQFHAGNWDRSWTRSEEAWSPRQPVERVSWADCASVCHQLGLQLPTEAQWEYAASAGTDAAFWCGDTGMNLAPYGNLADLYAQQHGFPAYVGEGWDDGCSVPAEVGRFDANPFGLHDTIGNVFEWIQDKACSYNYPVRPGDGQRECQDQTQRVVRGGSYDSRADRARSRNRDALKESDCFDYVGLRPARLIDY